MKWNVHNEVKAGRLHASAVPSYSTSVTMNVNAYRGIYLKAQYAGSTWLKCPFK